MKIFQRSALIAMPLLLVTFLVACGSTPSQGSTTDQNKTKSNTMNGMNMNTPMATNTPMGTSTPMVMNTPMGTSTPMANNNNDNNKTAITIVHNMMGNMGAFIHTGQADINGQMVNILVTNKDFALYYYRSDPMFQSTCTGQCAHDWPPLLAPQGTMTVTSSTPLPKQLSVHRTANGAQVFYDGHALYTYAADTQPGKATGRGQDGQWYLISFLL